MVQKTLANVANTVYIHLFRSTVTFKPGKHKTHFHAKSPDLTFNVAFNVRITITIQLYLYYNANNTRARKTHTVATPPGSRRGSWELVFSVDERLF